MNREVSFYDSEPNQHLNKPRFVFPAKATRRERQAGAFNLVNGMFLTRIWNLVREWLALSTRQRDKLKAGILAGQLLSGETALLYGIGPIRIRPFPIANEILEEVRGIPVAELRTRMGLVVISY